MHMVFLSLAFRLLTYTNPNILIDAKQWVKALPLFLIFESFVFHNSRAPASFSTAPSHIFLVLK